MKQDKRNWFLHISGKRVARLIAVIRSFKNFYSKHNKRYYEFSEEDMLKLDIEITHALKEWRESYQQHFKEERVKKLKPHADKLSKDLGVKDTDAILDWVKKYS